MAGIATNNHAGRLHLPPQPVHEPVGGTRNDGPVHSAFPSPHLATQSSGAEGEWPGETALQFGGARRVLKNVQHIGCGLRVGVMGGPVTCHIGDAHDLQLIDAPSVLGPTQQVTVVQGAADMRAGQYIAGDVADIAQAERGRGCAHVGVVCFFVQVGAYFHHREQRP